MRIQLTVLFSCLSLWLLAQVPSTTNTIDSDQDLQYIIENFVEEMDGEEFSFDTQFEQLQTYLLNPMDINKADEAQLALLGSLSALQIKALIEYRKRYGQILSYYELIAIPTFDRATVFKLLPYITLSDTKEGEAMQLGRWLKYSRRELFARYRRGLELARGFQPLEPGQTGTRYEGDPNQYYLRFRTTYRDRLSLGVTMEKDPGEAFFRGANPYGFDFYSAHLYLKDVNKYIKTLALGDYQVFLGQGLVMWGGFGIRKSPNVLNIRRVFTPIRAYTSVNEAIFSRGAAAQFRIPKLKRMEFITFASYRRRDAGLVQIPQVSDSLLLDSLGQDTDNPFVEEEVGSLPETGLHRTPNEIAQKNALGLLSTGGSLRYMGDHAFIALNVAYFRFDKPFTAQPLPYRQFAFNRQSLLNMSLEYRYNYGNMQFFGESALSDNGGLATLNGLIVNADSKLNFAVLQRYYAPNYQTLMANAFGESQSTNNEAGVYLGIELYPAMGWKFSAFADVYRFPWLRFQLSKPTQGWESFLRLEHTKSRRLSYYAQFRIEERPRDISSSLSALNVREQNQTLRQNLRFHLRYVISDELEIRSRIEFSSYNFINRSRGMVIYQDLVYNPKNLPLKTNMRIALFDTDDYDSRIYAYESDMLYQFSVPAYYGRGMRFYWNLNYSFNRKVSIWFRYAQTYFADRQVVSSGLNEIAGPRRSEVKMQLRYKF